MSLVRVAVAAQGHQPPGIIGVVSLALGAAAVLSRAKAYRASIESSN